ncbi:GH25 family lysozyme [Enterocloster lavalensis]|uniref:Glucan-binding repeat-containing protein n=1 Tax=Enterocloster lavalensis TaxID=460384 RepID=A0A1I0GDM9_9FIRM|nr:GH25 family lysozyme [Enterocloster lavalensis]SET68099.1 glucan-binding repeat-containing protein [Enterocloster lavalensis]
MKNVRHLVKRCQGAALAGMIVVMTGLPTGTAWAIGPGESGVTSAVTSGGPGGPGVAGGGSGGNTSGNSGSNSGNAAQSANPNAWRKVGGVYQMHDGTPIPNVLHRGIDVSRWQGDVNWRQVAADDVSFVMLGTRSKGAVDPYFHKNIQEAHDAGIQVGVYIYSLALNPEMAVQEADFVLDLIKDYPVSYPVAFDMEDSTQGVLSKEELAAIANAFCQRIKDAGYYPIIYANENWLKNKLDMSLMNYPVWVARYNAMYTYSSPVMWQATSTGAVNGIGGNVDIDFQFKDFSGVIPANLWRTIGGNTYYYQNHAMQKDTWINDGNGWYYMDGDGFAKKGWFTESGKRYYLDDGTGKMQYGWKDQDGKWYYLGSSGAASTGWVNDNGAWYFMDHDTAVMRTGWLDEGGKRFFLEDSGRMATGWTNQDNKWYYLDGSGALAKGWIDADGSRYYSNSDGVMHTGWLQDGGHWYFMRGNGAMAIGWRDMDGSWYFFNQDGQMVTGWQSIDGIWYYFDGNGHMATGMIDVGGVKYYLDDQGRMAANTEVTVDGVNYTADGSGALSLVEQPPAEGGEASNESPDSQSSPNAGQSGTNDAPVITGVSGGPGV